MYLPHPGSTAYSPSSWSWKLFVNALLSSRLDYCNSWDCRNWPHQAPTYFELSGSCGYKVTTIYSQCSTAALPSLAPVKYRVHLKICLLTYRAVHEEQPLYLGPLFAISLPSRSLRSNRGITLSIPRIRTNTSTSAFSSCALAPFLFGTTFHYLPIQPPRLSRFWTCFKTYLFRLGLPPVDTGVRNGLLMLRNSFNDFVFEHRSGCCTTEPGYAGDIGAIEIWLIGWLIIFLLMMKMNF